MVSVALSAILEHDSVLRRPSFNSVNPKPPVYLVSHQNFNPRRPCWRVEVDAMSETRKSPTVTPEPTRPEAGLILRKALSPRNGISPGFVVGRNLN